MSPACSTQPAQPLRRPGLIFFNTNLIFSLLLCSLCLIECIVILFFSADAAKGFGGKYGVQKDRQDSAALGYDHHEKVEKHASQKGYSRHI